MAALLIHHAIDHGAKAIERTLFLTAGFRHEGHMVIDLSLEVAIVDGKDQQIGALDHLGLRCGIVMQARAQCPASDMHQ